MKLHLPNLLRNAVIACMTVVSGVSTTVATGAFMGGAAIFAISTQQAQATLTANQDGTIVTYSDENNSNINLVNLKNTYPDLEKVVFDMTIPTNGRGEGNYFQNPAGMTKLDAVIQIGNDYADEYKGLFLNNGGSGTYEIADKVIGKGTIKKTGNGNNMILLFSGDVSDFTGKYELGANRTFTMQFGKEGVTATSSSTKGVAGTGNIIFTGAYLNGSSQNASNDTLVFAYDAGTSPIYVTNNISRKGKGVSRVTLTRGADYIFTKNSTIDYLTVDGGSAKFTAVWTTINNATLTGNVTLGSSVASNGEDRTLIKNLTATGTLTIVDQLALAGTLTLSQAAINQGTVYLDIADGFRVDLSNMTAEITGSGKGASGTYTLFTGGTVIGVDTINGETGGWGSTVDMSNLTSEQIASIITGVETAGKNWTYADGKLTYTIVASDLVWNTAGTFDWVQGTEFSGGVEFSNDDNVIFEGNLGDVVANINEDIVVSQLTVKGGTDLALAGSHAIAITKAVFEEGSGLTIGADQDINWAPTTMEGTPTLTVHGTLTVENNNFNSSDIVVDGGLLKTQAGAAYWAGNLTIDNDGVVEIIGGNDLFNYNDANSIQISNGGELKLNATRISLQNADALILNGGKVTGTGDGNGAVDFFENGTLVSDGESSIIAPIRIRNAGQTTTFQVNTGTLTISETVANGSLDKTGEGTLSVTGNLSHGGTTTVSAGTLQFAGSTAVDTVIVSGGSMAVTADGSATIKNLSGTGAITVAEGGVLQLTTITVAENDTLSITGSAITGNGFTKKGTGSLTMDALSIDGSFNMTGHEGVLDIASISIAEGSTLVYGKGEVVTLANAPTKAITMNVFAVSDSLSEGVNTGIVYTEGMDLTALQGLITVEGVDDFSLVGKEGYVYLTSNAVIETTWDMNWGATLADAPTEVKEGGLANLAAGTDGSMKLYDLYGNEAYTPAEGVVSISLKGDGDANAIVIGGNDAHTENGVGTVKTDVWIDAKQGTYKAIVGGNYANNWGGGTKANFEGDTHIKIDGATVGTVIGGNYKDGQGASFTGDSYISVFSGNVTGSIIGASLTTHNSAPTFTGNTNIFVYTSLANSTSQLHGEPADMVIGGFAWGANMAGTYTINGNTNITVDLTKYAGSESFAKHLVGGGYCNRDGQGGPQNHVVTGSTNIVADLGSIAMASGYKIVGGNWNDYSSSDIGETNITIKSGVFAAPVVGGSWVGNNEGTHKIGATNITISGGEMKGNVFGGSRVANGTPTLMSGDITILINEKANVTGDIFGGHSIETLESTDLQNGITANIDSITITMDGEATVSGDIIGGNYVYRNNNSNSTAIKTGDIVINLVEGTLTGNVYAGGYAAGTAVQKVNSATVNISSTMGLSAGSIISGGFAGTSPAAGTYIGHSTLSLQEASYSNLAGVSFVDFSAVSLGDDTEVSFASFSGLNKELTVMGKGKMNVTAAALAVDKLTLSGATVQADFGINPTTAVTLCFTEPSQLISRGGKDLTLAALEIDMHGASGFAPYVDIDGELKSLSKVNINLTGVADLNPGEYVLVSADSIGLAYDDINATFDATAPEGMEYVVEVIGNNIVFRSAFLSEWVWEGEGGVWSSDADGWKAGTGSPDGQELYFTAAAAGEVTVQGTVTPGSINVSGGEYTFVADAAGGSIELGTGTMTVSTPATLTLAMDNETLGGTTELMGKIVLQSDKALGNTNLQFVGGTLVYDTLTDDEGNKTHIATDLSTQTTVASNYKGALKIEVTDAENTVTWTKPAWNSPNSGIDAILASGIEKTGKGTMQVDMHFGSSTTHAGSFIVKDGAFTLLGTPVAGSGNPIPQLTFTGAMVVETFDSTLEFAFDHRVSGRYMYLNGNMSGIGTIKISDGGRISVGGNNTAFGGTLVLSGAGVPDAWNRVGFTNAAAFGSAATTVQVNGRGFYFGEKEITASSDVQIIGNSAGNLLDGSTNQKITFTGDWSVAEDAAFGATADGPNVSYTVTFAGDISDFKGTLRTRSNNTWVLGGDSVAGSGAVDMKEIVGDGKLTVKYSKDTVLNSVVGGTVNLTQSGEGKLILAAENTTTGTLTVDAGKEVQLGDATVAGTWVGTALNGEGTFTLVNGTLSGLTTKAANAKLVVATTAQQTRARMAGTGTTVTVDASSAALLDSIDLVAGSKLVTDGALSVGGAGTSLTMALTSANFGTDLAGITALIDAASLTLAATEGVDVQLNQADILSALNAAGEDGDVFIKLVNGTLALADGVDVNNVITPELLSLGVRAQTTAESLAGGYVIVNGDVSGIYFTDNQEGASAATQDNIVVDDTRLAAFAGTVINKGDTLTVSADAYINNLNGQEGGNFVVTDGASVVLNNAAIETGLTDPSTMGAANVLAGNLTAEEGTTLTITGTEGSSLTVGGNMAADTLEVTTSDLTVGGTLTADSMALSSADLTVGGALSLDTLMAEDATITANGATTVQELTLAESASMQVAAGQTLELTDAEIDGTLSGGADSALKLNGDVAVGAGASVSGFDVALGESVQLALSGSMEVQDLQAGSGVKMNGNKGTLSLAGTGSYAGALEGSGALKVLSGASLGLNNASGSSDWSLNNSGNLTIDITESGSLTMGALELAAGSATNLQLNSDNGITGLLTLGSLVVEEGASITLTTTGAGQIATGDYALGSVEGYQGAEQLLVSFVGTAFSQWDKLGSYLYVEGGQLMLHAIKSTNNTFAAAATHANAKAGAALLWDATAPVGGELESAYNAVNEMIGAGNTTAANEAMAAIAGSSTATLGMALSGDVDRQLRAIRNRTTTMGVNQCVVNEGMPYFNAWVNAEGNRAEMDKDSLASGYTLDSWGGTIGFDVDVNPYLTLGLAVTAMYGDLTVDGPDMMEGDFDTTYISAFARYAERAWTHTFIATVGKMDASVERKVSHSAGRYSTKGETDGMSFGFLYELGRTYALDEDGDAAAQLVANVAYRHTSVSGYTETASDAALTVGDQALNTITLGVGGRVQAVVGENIFNRTSIFEARALAKADLGDRGSEADVALLNGSGKGTVESAELGAFGVELGAGLSIPLGDEDAGTLFFDVSAELRSGYSNVNGTVGYRINF